MEKIIRIDGRDILFRATAAIPRLYRIKFGRDIMQDMKDIQQAVEKAGARVHIIDVRDHIGGNAYSYFDEETGAEIHKYGAHLFHTSNQRVWEYVNRFTEFTDYVHRVYATHDGEVYPLPTNLGTINQFFRAHYTPAEAKALIAEQAGELAGKDPENLNDKGISLIGRPLYEAFIKNYTAKQWGMPAEQVDRSVINRVPVELGRDTGLDWRLIQERVMMKPSRDVRDGTSRDIPIQLENLLLNLRKSFYQLQGNPSICIMITIVFS